MSTANSSKTYRLAIPSIPDRITEVDEFVESALQRAGVPQEVIADTAIAVTEIVNNAIDHGNAGDPEKTVTVELAVDACEISIVITDEGGGFDPNDVADPLAQENLLREVGRGIFIVRHLMDAVDIDTGPGRGTTVRVTKKLGPPAA
jgi:serine/threonine-protein kinase RsbW